MAEEPRNFNISLAAAAALTKRARESRAGLEKGGSFSREAVESVLKQPGCTGLRFYYGRHADGREALVLVGVDAKGNDMTGGVMIEDHWPCPPFCGDGNSLNS